MEDIQQLFVGDLSPPLTEKMSSQAKADETLQDFDELPYNKDSSEPDDMDVVFMGDMELNFKEEDNKSTRRALTPRISCYHDSTGECGYCKYNDDSKISSTDSFKYLGLFAAFYQQGWVGDNDADGYKTLIRIPKDNYEECMDRDMKLPASIISSHS